MNAPSTESTTFEQRLSAVYDQIREEPTETPGSAAEETLQAPPAAEASTVESAASEKPKPADDATKVREERRARLEQLKQAERENVERKAKQAEADKIQRQLAEAEKAKQELEARSARLVDLDALDETKFFELAQKKGLSPQRLGEWIRDQIADPEKAARNAAEHATKQALSPEIARLEAKLAEQQRLIDGYIAQQQAQAQQQAEAQAQRQFIGAISADASPLTHSFLQRFGHEELLKVATAAAQTLPEGAGLDHLLDTVEQKLEELGSVFGTPSKGKQPSKSAAAAKANTVSNNSVQERASVVDEDEFASLPFDERVARLKR